MIKTFNSILKKTKIIQVYRGTRSMHISAHVQGHLHFSRCPGPSFGKIRLVGEVQIVNARSNPRAFYLPLLTPCKSRLAVLKYVHAD